MNTPRKKQDGTCSNKIYNLWPAPIKSAGHQLHTRFLFWIIHSAAVKSSLVEVWKASRLFSRHLFLPSLVFLGFLLDFLLRLRSLCPAVVLFSHPDHRLSSGMALFQLLKSLRHLAKWKLGFHNRQDLRWNSKKNVGNLISTSITVSGCT